VGEIDDPDDVAALLRKPPEPLTDSTVTAIREIPGVELAFPMIAFPVRLEIDGHETKTSLRGLPASMGSYKPFSEIRYGEFFSSDDERAAVIRFETLEDMGLVVADPEAEDSVDPADSAGGVTHVPPDSVIGRNVKIITAVADPSGLSLNPLAGLGAGGGMFQEAEGELRISGILSRRSEFSSEGFHGGIFVPIETADGIPRLGFSSVWDLLGSESDDGAYASIYVRCRNMADTEPVRTVIVDDMGLSVFSIADQLDEIKKGFIILDSVLAAVGTVALFVAALGIVNTMVMSILERTREIGIMKAIGASDGEIRTIFFAEAATIGALGAVLGLILGWLVTRVANAVVNIRFMPPGQEPINLFHFPLWLILGAAAFSILVSLLAAVYPANRAARVDPVRALRHD
jgi:putative ABC transport system permease protein